MPGRDGAAYPPHGDANRSTPVTTIDRPLAARADAPPGTHLTVPVPLGGVRAVEQLKQVLIELDALPIRESVYFGDAGRLFDDEGNLVRGEFVRRIDYALADLAWYARTLRWGREHLPPPVRP